MLQHTMKLLDVVHLVVSHLDHLPRTVMSKIVIRSEHLRCEELVKRAMMRKLFILIGSKDNLIGFHNFQCCLDIIHGSNDLVYKTISEIKFVCFFQLC